MTFFNIDVETLPKQIEKNVLLEATIEIRYDTDSPVEFLIGKIYAASKNTYKRHQSTGAAHLPQALKDQNPDLKYVAVYFFEGVEVPYKINIGENTLSLSISNFKYKKWNDFYNEFLKIYNIIKDEISPQRIGVRYVNVFENDIFQNIKVDFKVDNQDIPGNLITLGCEFEKNERVVRMLVANKAQYSFIDNIGIQQVRKDAFVIDIDVLYQRENVTRENIQNIVDENHKIIKSVFFGLFDNDFITNQLKPTEEN